MRHLDCSLRDEKVKIRNFAEEIIPEQYDGWQQKLRMKTHMVEKLLAEIRPFMPKICGIVFYIHWCWCCGLVLNVYVQCVIFGLKTTDISQAEIWVIDLARVFLFRLMKLLYPFIEAASNSCGGGCFVHAFLIACQQCLDLDQHFCNFSGDSPMDWGSFYEISQV